MFKRLAPFLFAAPLLFSNNEENLEQLAPPTLDPSYQNAIWKTSVSLLAIIVFAFLVVWLYRKYGQSRLRMNNQTQSIKVLERRPLSQKTMLYIIEVEGKQVLIAESQLQVSALRSLDWNQAQDAKL